MAAGEPEDRAIALADQAVIDSQTTGMVKDLARVQRGGPLMRLWTSFYSYFSATFNLTAESLARTRGRDPASLGRFAVDMLLLYTVPAVWSYGLYVALGREETEDWAARLARLQLSYLFGTMVGFREIAGVQRGIRISKVSFSYGREPVLRDVSLDVAPGEVVALVGRTGAGKTTLADLLLRLHDPDSGSI